MTEEKMVDLARRCEEATGADDALDWQIAEAVGCAGGLPYTASIDAALTLVPDHCVYLVGDYKGMANAAYWQGKHQYARGWASVSDTGEPPHGDPAMPTYRSHAATPALALCAASLRARSAASEPTPNSARTGE